MPRTSGAIGYNKEILISVVKKILPVSMIQWEQVARSYFGDPDETEIRDPEHVKRQWIEVVCNKMKKPTGESGPSRLTARCQKIQDTINRAQAFHHTGFSEEANDVEDDDENDEDEDDDDDEEVDNFEAEIAPAAVDVQETGAIGDSVSDAATPSPKRVGSIQSQPQSAQKKAKLGRDHKKTKNSRNPRSAAAGPLKELAKSVSDMAAGSNMETVLQQMMVQQQTQTQMTMEMMRSQQAQSQQAQASMMQLVVALIGKNGGSNN